MSNLGSDVMNEMLTKELLYRESNIKVKYEFGQNHTKEEYEKMKQFQQESQTIAQAVYGASQFGWQIVSTNTVALKNDNRLHYIYMSK